METFPELVCWKKKERIISEFYRKTLESQEEILESSPNISEKIENFSEIIW